MTNKLQSIDDLPWDGWKLAASMEQIRLEHPEWAEMECRDEFNRLTRLAISERLAARKKGGRK